ncbi:hypothetical protein ACIHFD_15325 [Nonomuraea sp. NPDC051941]|uniref:hypothetical protein n=1 Tax=Nonomuraea sp. NPDC051941 TaxID=3364373 RepID=UPI0037C64F1B
MAHLTGKSDAGRVPPHISAAGMKHLAYAAKLLDRADIEVPVLGMARCGTQHALSPLPPISSGGWGR